MFPQYDRSDLLSELRRRGSAEAVVEAIILGVFSGTPRGGGGRGDAMGMEWMVLIWEECDGDSNALFKLYIAEVSPRSSCGKVIVLGVFYGIPRREVLFPWECRCYGFGGRNDIFVKRKGWNWLSTQPVLSLDEASHAASFFAPCSALHCWLLWLMRYVLATVRDAMMCYLK